MLPQQKNIKTTSSSLSEWIYSVLDSLNNDEQLLDHAKGAKELALGALHLAGQAVEQDEAGPLVVSVLLAHNVQQDLHQPLGQHIIKQRQLSVNTWKWNIISKIIIIIASYFQ